MGREPSFDEVANHLAFTPQRALAVEALVQPAISLDAPGLLDGGEGTAPPLADSTADVEEKFEHGQLAEVLHRGMAALPPREAAVLRSYYGLDGEQSSTLEQIGGRFGGDPRAGTPTEEPGLSAFARTLW